MIEYTYIQMSFIDICQIRLDFDTFKIGIGTTGTCSDSFQVTGPTNTNALSVLCGTLTGQHCKWFELEKKSFFKRKKILQSFFFFSVF